MSQKKARRICSPEEELTLVDGLMELCANGWRGENGTFKQGYLMELEHYIIARLPSCGLHLPHIGSKIRTWKKDYATISLLKSRRGLGFQYSDGTIIIDCPRAWNDLIKIDPSAKSMNYKKKWPLFADWEEIFGKYRATGEFVEGPEDVVEEIERSEAQEDANNMSLEFSSIVVDEDDVPARGENQAAQEPNVSTWAAF